MDSPRIGRVLNNLVGNALRHVQPGGSVTVTARPVPAGVQVEVIDDGPGIKPEDLPNIFERFYRGEKSRNRATGGAGLGLAIARGIVKAHHGEIGVESTPNQVTRFYFTLPRQIRLSSHISPRQTWQTTLLVFPENPAFPGHKPGEEISFTSQRRRRG